MIMKVNLLLRISKIRGTVAEPLYNKGSMLYADSHKTLGRVPSITLGYFLSPFKNIVTDIFLLFRKLYGFFRMCF